MKIDLRLTFHYGLTIFLSAFLLFQVQPLIGKMILPWFGGSASVWTTCMLFFQMVLLSAILLALGRPLPHAFASEPGAWRAAAGQFASDTDQPERRLKPTGAENPTLRILGLLTVSIGLPYFVLSMTGRCCKRGSLVNGPVWCRIACLPCRISVRCWHC
ncbi:hypothetical protein [Propionivibrio sp.]|uniref:hypothetical protein n=1 Tax=Propionivibrio sp. TaxID=2212460 RepID=UPI0025FCAB6D|nr:hypothetical protein [Propionivibrio sp.]MBK7357115.1 hypothetical protein [Propionivibrio sp.]